MPDDGDHFDIFQNYEIMAERRDDLKSYLFERGVGTLSQWGGKGIHQWEKLQFNLELPKTEIFFKKCLMLPMNAFITDEDVDYVCRLILDFYGK
jgi:dTDP-4-amino-4,6-dideoxygalactose transaminase